MAKDVITRFRLENNGFDSKIKQTAKTLSDLGKSATAAGKDFQEVTKGSVEAARAFGSIQTSSNNAKDRLKELTGAFNEVAKAYNSLTKEQQKSDWAKAMADSLTQLQQRIKDTKTELQGLGTEGGIFSKMGDKLGGAMSVFAGNLMTKATMEVANLGSEMAEMVKQGVEMAKAGEGIRIAFERLGNGQILDGLREATHGTVTDIELMKAAVKFNDFKLPLEELGTMLAFAQQKAKDTGQSVDYMVDSIVTGLGRKSLMILDNLGLSAAEIKGKMAETGDMTKAVGEIIREQMSKAGDYVETAADRAAQANVDLQNKLEELGRKFLPVQEASNQLWTSMKIGILDIVGGPLARLLNGLTEAGRLRNQMNDMAGGNSSSETEKQLNFLRKTSADKQQARYDKQIGIYNAQESNEWRRANRAKANLDKLKNAKPGTYDPETYASLKDSYQAELTDATRKAQAWQNFRINYQKGAQGHTESSKGGQFDNINHHYHYHRKGWHGGSRSLSTPEQADAKYVQAQKDYEQSLQQAALEVKAGTINSAEAKKKELQAAETLWKSIGDAREVYDSPKLKEAQANVEAKIVALGPEVEKAIEAQKAVEKASRELEMANKKAADARTKLADAEATGELKKILPAQKAVTEADREVTRKQSALQELQDNTIKVNVEQGSVNLPKVPTDDETIKVNVEQGDVNLPKVPTDDETIKVNVEQGDVNLPKVPTDDETIKVNVEQGDVNLPKVPTDDETIKVNVEQGNVNLPKVPTDDETIKVNVEQGSVNLPKVPTDDQTIKVNVEEGNVNLPKVPTDDETIKVNVEQGSVNLPEIPEEKTIKVDAVPGDVKLPEVKEEVQIPAVIKPTQDNIDAAISFLKDKIAESEIGTDVFNKLTEQLSDATALGGIISEMVKQGVDTADFSEAINSMWAQLKEGDIDDSAIQTFLGKVNEKIKDQGGIQLDMNANTGEVSRKKKDDDDTLKETQKVVSGLSQVASGLQAMGITLPSEVTKVLNVLQGAMSVVQGVGTIISVFSSTAMTANSAQLGFNTTSLGINTGAIASLEAAIWANTAASWWPFAEGGVVPKFAEGGVIPRLIGKAADGMLIPGNSYSGDRLRMPVDGGRGVIGVNSGELILNMSSQDNLAGMIKSAESLVGTIRDESMALGLSQVGVLADALDNEGGGAISSTPYVTGEQIYLGLNNYLKGAGLGQIVTSQG